MISVREQKYNYLYKITNNLNDEYYIGIHSTNKLEDNYFGSGTRLWRSIEKYGKENFSIEILEFLPNREALKNRERELVTEDVLKDVKCLNLQPGGGGGISGDLHHDKLKKGASSFQTKKWEDEKYREKHSEYLRQNNLRNHALGLMPPPPNWTGKKHREETKIKIGAINSILQMGTNNSQYGTMWVTDGVKNIKIKKSEPIPENFYRGRTLK
jgi:group I intron endonuclease